MFRSLGSHAIENDIPRIASGGPAGTFDQTVKARIADSLELDRAAEEANWKAFLVSILSFSCFLFLSPVVMVVSV
jgi:hypothetical protein